LLENLAKDIHSVILPMQVSAKLEQIETMNVVSAAEDFKLAKSMAVIR